VDRGDPGGLNAYRYVLGTNSVGALGNGPVTLRVLEAGPLVATLRVESDAPGCERLIRDIRLVDGLDRVEFFNRVDRKSVREKDGVHFGFAFAVPRGEVRMETPWGVVRPDVDQLPGANRNWYTVQRWVEVSNRRMGVTWSPLDAPLMEVGGLTANLLGSVALHEWRTNAVRSSTIYSWAQNNHWHTNYKIDQPGLTTFRYALRPHRGGYSASEAARFGIETSRPLIAGPATPQDPPPGSLFTVSSPDVLVESVKVSDDGQALILRLFGVSGKTERVRLTWDAQRPESLWMTDLTERRRAPAARTLEVPGYGVVSLRAQMRGDADR
jgi:alpha-mannosidase